MDITQHFTLEEFEKSNIAKEKGIENVMPARFLRNAERLCMYVLEPLRDLVGCPIVITSGYRSPALNEAVNGSSNSQHMKGEAADIRCDNMKKLVECIMRKWINLDQAIIYDTFVHVSYTYNVTNRKQLIDKRTK